MSTRDDALRFLGKHVKVTLHESATEGDPVIVAVGKLLGLDEGGESVIEDDMGFVHYCWPALHIEESA